MRNFIRTLFVIALVAAGASGQQPSDNSQKPDTNFDGVVRPSELQGVREAYLPAIFASAHAANLLRLRNGDTLCFWFSGTWEGNSDVAIVVSRLPAGSNRWTKTMVVDHQIGKSFQNAVGFQASAKELWVLHTSQDANAGQANAEVLIVKSEDGGLTWGAPKPLFIKPGSFTRQPMVVMATNEWMLPMYYTPSKGITTGAESNYSAVEITRDEGQTWKEYPMPKTNGLVQPSVIKLKNGHYVAFFRSRYADWIYRSTSDDGKTWSDPEKTVLPNNNSSIQAAGLRNGDIVMAFNNVNSVTVKGKPQAGPRKPLTVAISQDGGKTWPWARDLETGRPGVGEHGHLPDKPGREEYSYPTILQGADGNLQAAYTYRRETIKYVTFSEDWIKNGVTTGTYKLSSK